MRFWITKNSELSVREQLVRQVQMGILSDDLPAGYKLPSVRAVARRHHVHANTVSAAYHDLLTQQWLELRRGSGLYVLPLHRAADGSFDVDALLAKLLQEARAHGYQPNDVLQRLTHLLHPCKYERVLIADPRPAMLQILKTELEEHLQIPVEPFVSSDPRALDRSIIVALPTQLRTSIPQDALFIALRLRSVRDSLEGQSKPGPDATITVISRSPEIRQGARAMLIAVGLAPDALNEIDANAPNWQDRLSRNSLVISDIVAANELPPDHRPMVFRIIADSSIAQLKKLV